MSIGPNNHKSFVETAKSIKNYFEILKENYQNALKTSENDTKTKTKTTLQRANQDDLINENTRQEILVQIEKVDIIQKALNKIETGTQDAEIIILLGTYINEIDGKMCKMKNNIIQLNLDNLDLQEQIDLLKNKLQISEDRNIELEIERDHFKFLYELEINGGIIKD